MGADTTNHNKWPTSTKAIIQKHKERMKISGNITKRQTISMKKVTGANSTR